LVSPPRFEGAVALGDITRMMRSHALELLRFALVGVANTAATLIVIYALMAVNTNLYMANFVGYAIGLLISFTLNRRWTFRSSNATDLLLVRRFLLAVGAAYCVNLLMVFLSVRIGLSPYIAQLAGMPAYTACFYLLSKFYVFRHRRDGHAEMERFMSE
jgi:putative flippase GtrA